MAYLIFEKDIQSEKTVYQNKNEQYKLAGWGLIYDLWKRKGKIVNEGYSLSADEILKQYNDTYSSSTHSLVIDFHPSSIDRIGLVEIDKIHLYTFGCEDKAYWTPMMFELIDIFYEEGYDNLSVDEKNRIISSFDVDINKQKLIEFLYLNGDDYSWNWGRNGMTNACFIYDEPRKYFRNFF